MATIKLERVKSLKSGRTFEVKWDPASHDLYVDGNHIGKAMTATEAMQKAEAWAYNK